MVQTEVTVQVFSDFDSAYNHLISLGYKNIKEFLMQDYYFSSLQNTKNIDYKNLINNSFLVRELYFKKPEYYIIYKDKVINNEEEVVMEDVLKMPIENPKTARDIFLKSNLNNWCNMNTKIIVLKKDKHTFMLQEVENLGLFIEYEEDETMNELSLTEKREYMINTLKSLNLKLGDDFSCKKNYMLFNKINTPNSKEFLNKTVKVVIDRQLGTKHPKHNFIYPVNYGYIPNTLSGDGEELDAYVLGENAPVKEFTGKVIAVIHRLNDNDDKLVVVKDGVNYTNEEIKEMVSFQEKWFVSEIIK